MAKDNLKASEKQHDELASQLDETNTKMIDMKRREVELESEKVAFQKFIEMLSLEMEERLGEEIVSTDTEANSLQEKADLLGKQISAHLTPSRKIQENVQDLKEEVSGPRTANIAYINDSIFIIKGSFEYLNFCLLRVSFLSQKMLRVIPGVESKNNFLTIQYVDISQN